jgi:hypothetical protein
VKLAGLTLPQHHGIYYYIYTRVHYNKVLVPVEFGGWLYCYITHAIYEMCPKFNMYILKTYINHGECGVHTPFWFFQHITI